MAGGCARRHRRFRATAVIRRACASLGLALLLVAAPAWAHPPEDGQQPSHGSIRSTPVPAGVKVPGWAELSDAQREKLASLAPQWDTLPASRRVRALEHLDRKARWAAMTPEQRGKMRKGARNFRDLPPELREKMRLSMAATRALPEPERKNLFRLWRALNPEQRRAWLEAGGPGISPPPDTASPAR